MSNQPFDLCSYGSRIVVGPRADHRPPSGSELRVRIRIPLAVALNLLSPPHDVPTRRATVEGAAVPITAVNEDSYASAAEDDVRTTARGGLGAVIDSVAKAPTMQ